MKQATPIHLLRSFEAAARLTSFTLAAQELHITQAAVSKQIKALEKELNCSLFYRHAHGVSLTQLGERYWRDIHTLLGKFDTITTSLFHERNADIIRIRANISYSVDVLAEKFAWFQAHHPKLTIELTHSVWSGENRQDNVDIEIDYRSVDNADKTHHLLHRDMIFPVVSAAIHGDRIFQLPCIHILGYYNEWRWWLSRLSSLTDIHHTLSHWAISKRQEIRQNRNLIRVDNSLIAYKLCAQGSGCALGRSSLARPYIDAGLLKRIDEHTEFEATEGFHAQITESGKSKPACIEFIDYLRAK